MDALALLVSAGISPNCVRQVSEGGNLDYGLITAQRTKTQEATYYIKKELENKRYNFRLQTHKFY